MRQLSIHRRKPGLVDLLIAKTPGAAAYRLKWGTNFDTAVFTGFLDVPNTGYCSPTAVDADRVTLYGDRVRAIFNPVDHAIPDDEFWWLKMVPLDSAGAEITASATRGALMVLTPDIGAGSYFPQLTITGTAPNVAAVADSLQIDFPQQMRDVRIQSAAALWVAYAEKGPEILLQGDTLPKDLSRWATQSTMLVRGNGAAVPFSLLFTLAYTR